MYTALKPAAYFKFTETPAHPLVSDLYGGKHHSTIEQRDQKYKWVPVNCWGNLLAECLEVACDGLTSHPREEVAIS